MSEDSEVQMEASEKETRFKKPMLVGKIGRLPKRMVQTTTPTQLPEEETIIQNESQQIGESEVPVQKPQDGIKSVRYEEPHWSGVPQEEYTLDVLKNGAIIENIKLDNKAFWIFGRLPNCDVYMQHPTISRYHVVLQYRNNETGTNEKGYYIYDLESTHGTFLNKNRIRPRCYVRIRVGHMMKLGCSTRTYILNGPEEDAEAESELSVTELKQKRFEELQQRQQQEEDLKKKKEEGGIDWGLGEDADEEQDLSENPYAQTNNEELYLDNPKKALRGFFEREGLDLEYDCSEQGMGQFVCKVELPLDDEMGRSIFAEVIHKGKKKEAVVQCALEACRILDRYGVLRQAVHESRKRKPKNWEENDYYDSDDDTFLDRTGCIEKKREMRMHAKQPQKGETYENLLEKETEISKSIKEIENQLVEAQRKLSSQEGKIDSELDPLDSFMMELKHSKPNQKSVNKLKTKLSKMKQQHGNVINLINIAKPVSLPPLVAEYAEMSAGTSQSEKKNLPVFGKRKKVKLEMPAKKTEQQTETIGPDDEEEEEEHENIQDEENKVKEKEIIQQETSNVNKKQDSEEIDEKKRKRNQKRIQQKQERAEIQKQKGYAEDENKEDYNMWVPPSGQTGDGRTSLNDKYGY